MMTLVVLLGLVAPSWAQQQQELPPKRPLTEVEKQIFGDEGNAPVPVENPHEPAANATSPFARVARENEAAEKNKPNRPRKFITLTLGVELDEALPPVPKNISFRGDYRRVTKVSYAQEIKSIRFSPTKEGVGTLTVHDSKGAVVAEYRIEVRKSRLDTIMREMQGLLGDIEGISIKVVNNKVVV